jgi:hypothetical protein
MKIEKDTCVFVSRPGLKGKLKAKTSTDAYTLHGQEVINIYGEKQPIPIERVSIDSTVSVLNEAY